PGTRRNITAGTATLKGIVRTMEGGLSEKIEEAVRRMLEGIKTGMRVDYALDWKRVAPALRNHKPTLARVLDSARDVLGAENVIELPEASMGSEDFAWFAEKIPAAHLRIGNLFREPGEILAEIGRAHVGTPVTLESRM